MRETAGPATLVDVLRHHARMQPERAAVVFPGADGAPETTLTYAELDRRARAAAAALQARVSPGDRALLPLESEEGFLTAFLGCLYAGVVAVPTALEASRDAAGPRLRAILQDATVSLVAATETARRHLAPCLKDPAVPPVTWLSLDTAPPPGTEDDWQPPTLGGGAPALLQYTSGSTGTPRGVRVDHDNLSYDLRVIRQILDYDPGSTLVNWMPLFHDGGLILMTLAALYSGARLVLISPAAFIRDPLGWLRLVSRYGACSTVGPNFAYDLCARRAAPERCRELDLRSLRCAMNGSEPVHAATLERFSRAFAPCGFHADAFTPNYGLAEATILVTSKILSDPPLIQSFDARGLDDGRVVPVAAGAPDSRPLVGCGAPCPGLTIAVADPESGRRAAPDRVGEIWVAGPGVARGYWNHPRTTARVFGAVLADSGEGPFLRTGDLGFLHDGNLFVAGRIRDLVIIRGQNHYPQDIEAAAGECSPCLRPGGGAAFPVTVDEEERLVVLHEVRAECREGLDGPGVIRAIRRRLGERLGLAAHAVALVAPKSLPKTTSGKLQRFACREAFEANRLETWAAWRETAAREEEEPGPREAASLAALLADPPRLETALTALAANVLREPALQPGDNFFHSGGDSLRAARFILAVEDGLGVRVAAAFLENPTVAHLVRRVTRPPGPGEGPSTGPVPGEDGGPPLGRPPHPARKARWWTRGPVCGGRNLPYGPGFFLQRVWLGVPGMRRLLFRPGIAAVRRWSELVGEESPSRAVRQSLLTNTWIHWRNRVLAAPPAASPWLRLQGDLAGLWPGGGSVGTILLLLHSPLSGLFRRCLAAEGRRFVLIRGEDEEKSTQAQNRSMQVYLAHTALRDGGAVVIYGDGGKGRQGVTVPFFGAPRTFRPGAGELAAETGASVVPVFGVLEGNGRVVFEICPPLAAGGGSPHDQALSLTRGYAALVTERWPRVYPFQSWSNLERLLFLRARDGGR
ncbi:MAG: AMP-binding protein [Acidobacteria bacterium]|nr:AMP-binding protein [Acidobacteriota bacterium]